MYENDAQLAYAISQRDEAAFNTLIDLYGRLITAIVKYHMKDIPMWQEDCINDVLFSVWQNIDRFDDTKNSLKNWLGAIAKYRAINYKRKFYRELVSYELNEDLTDGKAADTEIMRKEIENDILSLLSNLKEEDRDIFIRRYIMEQSVSEIAVVKNTSPSVVYNRISRGRKKIRQSVKWSDSHEK